MKETEIEFLQRLDKLLIYVDNFEECFHSMIEDRIKLLRREILYGE